MVCTSDEALHWKTLPKRLLIVGGGVIGCEFACILAGLGARVSLVEAMPRLIPLPSMDPDTTAVLLREMKKRKIQVHLGRTVSGLEPLGTRVRAVIAAAPGGTGEAPPPITAEFDKVIVAVGRRSNSAGLGLERLGLAADARGWLDADEGMRAGAPGVFAIGDALGPAKIMLAHVASAEGLVAAENALGASRRMDYGAVPAAVFTSPEVAAVGLTEAQAGEAGLAARAETFLFRALGKAQAMGEIAGQIKLVWDAGSQRVLGVHLIGAHATDLVAEATLTVRLGVKVGELAETIHAHPTLAEAMLEVAHRALGAPIHALKETP